MISTRWIEKRKAYWARLEQLLEQASRRGFQSLTRNELQEIGLLYRQIAADLATLREDRGSVHFARYLNQLLARAHHIIYSAPKASPAGVLRFFLLDYPRVFRRNLRFVQVALGIFALSAALGAVLAWQDPEFKLSILGPQMVETIEKREMWTHSIVSVKPLASSAIMTNNLSVAFVTFAFGITAGLGTIYMLAFNGLLLGVIAMACHLSGMSLKLWEFVAPHGVLELPAILLAGGAGLRIAAGLLFPGYLPRRDSLMRAGAEAVQLLLGAIPLLFVAGIIEGFVSPGGLSTELKFALAAALFVLLLAYLFSPGAPAPTDDSSL